ncbi:MAG TPA: FtsX-like permease family protein [Micromonosporaceae bacterium]
MTGWTVMLRGIGFRAGRSLLVVVIATIAVASAVATAGYVRAAQQSVLTDGLRNAPSDQTQLSIGASDAPSEGVASMDDSRLAISQALGSDPLLAKVYGKPIQAEDTDAYINGSGIPGGTTWIAYRDGVCAHVILTGQCPTSAGQVMVSKRSAAANGIKVGAHLSMGLGKPYHVPPAGVLTAHGAYLPVRVVGIYTPRDVNDPYWGGNPYFGNGEDTDSPTFVRLDTVFTGSEQDVRANTRATVYVHAEMLLNSGTVTINNLPAVQKEIADLGSQIAITGVNNGLAMTTGITIPLAQVTQSQHSLATTIPVVAVPLIVLCLFVLFLVVAALTDERAPEIALAKLRGYTSGAAARFGIAEMLMLITIATPLGLVLGFGMIETVGHTIMAAGTHAEIRWPIFAAAGAAMIAGYLAAWLATRSTVRRGVLSLMRRVPQRTGWRAGIGVGLAVAFVAAALVAAFLNRSSPIAWLAAPSIALIAGLVAARLLSATSAGRLRLAARRGRLVGIISGAWLARQSGRSRIVAVLTVAVALLVFGAVGWDVGSAARTNSADDTLGAQRVYSVTAVSPAALTKAVDTADASGDSMAVTRSHVFYNNESVDVFGVDATRLAAVGVWRGKSAGQIAAITHALRPVNAPTLTVRGTINVTVNVAAVKPGQVALGAMVVPPGQAAIDESLGDLVPGRKTYSAVLSGCEAGCRFVGLTIGNDPSITNHVSADLEIDSIVAGKVSIADFSRSSLWQAQSSAGQPAGSALTIRSGRALDVSMSSDAGAASVVAYQDSPAALPVVASGGAKSSDPTASTFSFPGFGGTPMQMSIVDRSAQIPRAGTNALLFDLSTGLSVGNRINALSDLSQVQYEVWANAQAPADLGARLSQHGVSVLQVQTIPEYLTALSRSAPTLSLWFYLFAGGLALILAIGVVLLGAYVGAGARIYEYAALKVAGVRPRVLRRAVLREYWTMLGITLVVGVAAGLGGAVLMLPSIPLVTVGQAVGTVPYGGRMFALYGALVITLIAMAVVVAMALRVLRRGTPDRLREGTR